VLGARGKIKDLIKENDIKEIIIAIPSLAIQDLSEIARLCDEHNISYRVVRGILDEDSVNGFIKNQNN
jgi:FlaA1/EpsC-like NDP-sugar epimerase